MYSRQGRNLKSIHAELPQKLIDLLWSQGRYKVAHGGRGSAKSWSFARALVLKTYQAPLRVLCAREVQNSIQESVHRLLSDQIDLLGLSAYFEVQRSVIRSHVGSDFIFAGLRSDPQQIKSTEGVDICWVEEAAKVSEESWKMLIPTIRKPGSEIWASFNPDDETDPTYKRFIKNSPPGAKVVKVSWRDNPWFSTELEAERTYMAQVDPDAYAHVWEGECRRHSDAQVLGRKCEVSFFEPSKDWDGPYLGADWGFAQDPTTLVKCWINGHVLHVEQEAYGVGIDIDRTADLFDRVNGARDYVIRADSARPETISYMQRHGYPRIQAAMKWPGSVEDGIAVLRSFERIVIHPSCTKAYEESRLWSYKTDRLTGDVLPDVVDAHNHIWDAVRYALQPIIRGSGTGMLDFISSSVKEMSERK